MNVKTIKNVDEKTWYEFKKLSVKTRLNMSKLLEKMISTYEAQSTNFWKDVFEGEKLISDSEAELLQEHTKNLRRYPGFRQ